MVPISSVARRKFDLQLRNGIISKLTNSYYNAMCSGFSILQEGPTMEEYGKDAYALYGGY